MSQSVVRADEEVTVGEGGPFALIGCSGCFIQKKKKNADFVGQGHYDSYLC